MSLSLLQSAPDAPECEPCDPPPSIHDLPQDVLVLLACMLEGPSLCRLSALTTNALRAAFADILAPVWVCKHQLLLESAFPTPDDEAGATELCAHSESAAKAAYARSWSALERRCRAADGEARRAAPTAPVPRDRQVHAPVRLARPEGSAVSTPRGCASYVGRAPRGRG